MCSLEQSNQIQISVSKSHDFQEFLHCHLINIGLAIHQANRLVLLGCKEESSLSEQAFNSPTSLHCTKDRFFLATRFQVWRLENILAVGEKVKAADRLFVPRAGYTTGNLNIHDLSSDGNGNPIFCNTLYSCLATLSETHSFTPLWKPSFISRLVPEDRCHLNGLAMDNGQPGYVTAMSCSNVAKDWWEKRNQRGVLIDVNTNDVVCDSLSMPCSPRIYNGKVWLLNRGTGELGFVDLVQGKFEPVVYCPGYLSSVAFYGRFAIIAISQPSDSQVYKLLKSNCTHLQNKPAVECGLVVVDLEKGTIVHWLKFDNALIKGLCSVQVIPDTRCATLPGFNRHIQDSITFQEDEEVIHHSLKVTEVSDTPESEGKSRTDNKRILVRLQMSCKEVDQRFNALSFPPISRLLAVKHLNEPLLCSMIVKNDHTVALAVMEKSLKTSGTVVSLFVLEGYRGNGFGQILLQDIEQQAKENNIHTLFLQYHKSWGSCSLLEKILAKLKWQEPQMHSQRYRTTRDLISKAPWVWETSLPHELEIFPWHELKGQEADEIRQRQDYPPFLTPFQEEERISYNTSFGLRYKNRISGWIITHRTRQDTLQYTSLYVQSNRRLAACGLKMLAAAIRSQIEIKIPYFIFMINKGNIAGMNLTNRRIRPYLLSCNEVYSSQKMIVHGSFTKQSQDPT